MRAEHAATARTRPAAVKIDIEFLNGECIIRSEDLKAGASCSESVSAILLVNSYLERSLKGNISAREDMWNGVAKFKTTMKGRPCLRNYGKGSGGPWWNVAIDFVGMSGCLNAKRGELIVRLLDDSVNATDSTHCRLDRMIGGRRYYGRGK